MNQQKSLLRISELLSRFKVQTGILNASCLLDINVIAEDFLIPILNTLFECNLINANRISKNFPAIDLIDKKCRISFQITSTSKPQKIRETLEGIVKNGFYNDYNKFYILIISEKIKKYDTNMINTAINKKFNFTNENILDIETLFIKIRSLSFANIQKLENYLETQYTDEQKTNDIIEGYLHSLITNLKKLENHYLASKLETAYKVRLEWYEKKTYLEFNSISVSDIPQKYSIDKSIAECNKKIEFYENEIFSITSQINKGYE
jgi:hypothetical protein